MTDGPHRSLSMPRGWKRLAERADRSAYAPEEVRDALPEALIQDWRAEVPDGLFRQVQVILGDGQVSMFIEHRSERLEALRGETAGYPLASVLLDYAILVAERGRHGDEALTAAAAMTLSDRAARGARQVEEHFQRESTLARATHVRERIETGVADSDMAAIAARFVGIDDGRGESVRPVKQTGLDDGVQL